MKPKLSWDMFPLILVVFLFALALLFVAAAKAHDAPEGWSYDLSCCSGDDCAQVHDDKEIRATDAGYLIVPTGEIIAYVKDPRLRQSKDEYFHRCIIKHGSGAGTTRCLYAPSQGN